MQIITGRNGTGKTAIIELLAKLRYFLEGREKATTQSFTVSDLCSVNDIPRWDFKEYGKYTTTIGFKHNSKTHGRFEYEIKIEHSFGEGLNRVFEEKVIRDGVPVYLSQCGEAHLVTDDQKARDLLVDWKFSGLPMAKRYNSKLRAFYSEVVAKITPLSLDPRSMSAVHDVKSEIITLSGSNFSSWYDHLRDKYDREIIGAYSEYENFIIGFDRFRFEPLGKGQRLLVDCHAAGADTFSLSFEELSHGQKILCILYLLLKTAPVDATILIDEFENYLAPSEFVPFYNNAQLAASERGLQIVLVSHHEKTLNWYHDQALIFSLDSTLPSTVRVQRHDPENYQGSLSERIEIDGE